MALLPPLSKVRVEGVSGLKEEKNKINLTGGDDDGPNTKIKETTNLFSFYFFNLIFNSQWK